MKNVTIYEAKSQLSRLLTRARAGEEIIISKSGVPIAKLVPVVPQNPEFVTSTRTDVVFEPLPENEAMVLNG